MNLAIDIGNSVAKIVLIDQGQVVDFLKTEEISADFVTSVLDSNPEVEAAILISARDVPESVEALLRTRLGHFIHFDTSVPVPIHNGYATPQTLGPDRLAAAVGANAVYPHNNVLIVDFGTAITFDVVSSQSEFLGGNISPGANTRFRALHEFTARLPLLTLTESTALLGSDSESAIQSGVINGIVYEIEGYIRDLEQKYDDLRIIFTGGDGNFFAKRIKNPIFATHDLVPYGLNRILEYNAKE